MAKYLQQCFSLWSLIDTSLLNLGNDKRLCLFCLIMQKHCWNYFAFNQSYLAKSKIAPVVVLPHEAKYKYMILHSRIRTGSDWWFSKILRIRTGSDSILSDQAGLGLKNFTVRSSLLLMSKSSGVGTWQSNARVPHFARQAILSGKPKLQVLGNRYHFGYDSHILTLSCMTNVCFWHTECFETLSQQSTHCRDERIVMFCYPVLFF